MSVLTEKQILSRARASSLENVKNLNFWGCEISDLSVLHQMPNVEVLSLSVNSITTLRDFAYCTIPKFIQSLQKCPKLRELYLRKNNISDLAEVRFLKNLPRLRVLWLSDNPCAESQEYRSTVLRNLPKLNKLDNAVVEEAEFEEAANQGSDISTPEDIPVYTDLAMTQEVVNNGGKQEAPDGQTELVKTSLVDETNKLRAELGIKPLHLETDAPAPIEKNSPRGDGNILSAVLLLVKELNRGDLEAVKNAVDQQLQEIDSTGEESPPEESSRNGMKEVIAD